MDKCKGEEQIWDKIKYWDGTFKFDIDSIFKEQVKFYENNIQKEGWVKNKCLTSKLFPKNANTQ